MDSNLIAMAEVIRREAARVRVFDELDKFLLRAGSLEQATVEREQALAKAKENLSAVMAQVGEADVALAGLGEQIKAAEAQATDAVASGRSQAEKIVSDARVSAHQFVLQSNAEATADLAAARANAKRLTDDAQTQSVKLKKENADLQATIVNVRNDIAAATQELAALNAKIEDARRAARKLFEPS